MLRRVFRPKRDEVTGEWRKLHNDELRTFTSYSIFAGGKIEKNEMGGGMWRAWWRGEVCTGF